MDTYKAQRIQNELKQAGAGNIAMHTPEEKALLDIIHDDEHIGGIIYGRYTEGLAWLIATDRRVIFMDKKPLFTTTDEISYDIVTGTKMTRAGLFTSVTLHTRVADYAIRFVKSKCAKIFVNYLESRRLESTGQGPAVLASEQAQLQTPLSNEALTFLKEHDLAVLSTVDRTGNVHGAVVYYVLDQRNFIYIMTKSETEKGRDVYVHSQVAITIHEVGTLQTAQVQGMATIENDQKIKDTVFNQIMQYRTYRGEKQLPPITKLHEGLYVVIRIRPTSIVYHDYAKMA